MKNVSLLACASIVLTMGASAALADDNRYYNNGYNDNGGNSWQDNTRYYDNDYYDNGGNNWQYRYYNNGSYSDYSRQPDWNNGGYNYRQDIVSPRSIVRNLQNNDYRNISQPVLSGNFYQVKAVSPNGHSVKLYIDPYSGRIAKVKG
jgi:hypothetical protein